MVIRRSSACVSGISMSHVHFVADLGQPLFIAHSFGEGFNINCSSQETMNQNICVSSNWRSEVSVSRACQTVMAEFRIINICGTEIIGFIHSSCCQDSDEFIEKFIILSLHFVQGISQVLGGRVVKVISERFQEFAEFFNLFGLRSTMLSQN